MSKVRGVSLPYTYSPWRILRASALHGKLTEHLDGADIINHMSILTGGYTPRRPEAQVIFYCSDNHLKDIGNDNWIDVANGNLKLPKIKVPSGKRPCNLLEAITYANDNERFIIMCPHPDAGGWSGLLAPLSNDDLDKLRFKQDIRGFSLGVDYWEMASLPVKIIHELVHALDVNECEFSQAVSPSR